MSTNFILWLIMEAIFLADMVITFRLAYKNGMYWVTDKWKIALRYLRSVHSPYPLPPGAFSVRGAGHGLQDC